MTAPLRPLLRRGCEGAAEAGLSIDRIVGDSKFLAISGWLIGGQDLTFTVEGGGVPALPSLTFYSRDDVASGYGVPRTSARGFLAIWKERPFGTMQVRLEALCAEPLQVEIALPGDSSRDDLAHLITENLSRAGLLFEALAHDRPAASVLIRHLTPPPASFNRARGHIETARGIEGVGGLAIGWTVAEPGLRFALVDEKGQHVALDNAARWTRNDILEAVGGEFGAYAFEAGFLQGWRLPLRIGAELRLVALAEDTAYLIATATWTPAPIEPVSFARWAFDISTPRETFADRLAQHDGPIIGALVERKIARRPKKAPIVKQYGQPAYWPKCSVVIPLHGRHDFLLNQLLAFSDDPSFLAAAEIVYVIDDHRLVSPLAADAPMLAASYKAPFRTIWSGENRGFAGATNLGVAHSYASHVLLMNSDVIPVAPGWLDAMLETMEENPQIGILGARLHYPNGSIQHDGMEFRWEPGWQAYLNKHPGAGLSAAPAGRVWARRPAVTAACKPTANGSTIAPSAKLTLSGSL